MHIVRRLVSDKVFIAVAILFLALLTSLLTGKFAYAADPSIIRETCYSTDSAFMSTHKSPFSQTSGMCLGDGDSGQRFYQFGIQIPVPIDNVMVTARDGNNTSIGGFRKVSNSLYVSDNRAKDRGMGYRAFTGTPGSCNRNDPAHNITIEATANGKAERIKLNLCDYLTAESTLIYKPATTLRGDSGQVAQVGTISGKLGIIRDGAPTSHGSRLGTLEKAGIMSIKLSGPETLEGNNNSDWYSLGGGDLKIKTSGGIKPGIYTLSIVYNDKIVLATANPPGDPGWTTDNLRLNFSSIRVTAGENTFITTPADKIAYYDKDGKLIDTAADAEADRTSCVIDGVGWIVCGMSKWLAQVMDGVYGLLTLYLTTPSVNTDIKNEANTLYRVWSVMRNIANVAFVIAFLIIIYSQLTGMGINNYGIKKIMPRLIVAAVLVNASYWITAIAVDLSNITGSGIYNLIRGISHNLGGITIASNAWEISLTALLAGGSVAVTGGAIAATAAAVGAGVVTGGTLAMAALWIAIPAVLTGLLAVVIAFAILAARQALIIILIILAPLAFVALLLPNTEGMFKAWRKTLMTMLVFYPIFSIIFAGSQMASMIILSTAGGGSGDVFTGKPVGHIIVLALFIQVIPLILTPMLVKFSGGLIGQLAGMVNNKSKGLIDRSRKVRDRKVGLARDEVMSNAARTGGRNPFARTARFMGRAYRRTQNDTRVDADRQKVLDSQNQAAYLGEDKAAQLSTGLKNAQLEVQKLEAEHNAEFEVQKDVDLTYKLNLANQKVEASKLGDKKTYEESLSTSQAIATGDPLAQQKLEARDTQRAIDVANNQLNFAKSTIQQEYAKDLQADPVLANAAGGIDPHGEQKVVASAIEAQRKAYDANVAAFGVRLEGTDDTRLLNKAMTASTIEEREAAGRAIVKGGNIDTITEYQNYLATEFANAGSAGNADAVRDIQTLQRAYAATIGSSPGKPMGLGAADIAQFNTGSYIAPSSTITLTQEYDATTGGFRPLPGPRALNTTEVQTLSTVENKGVSMDKWASMDKSDIKRVIDLANVGAISATRAADMKKTIQDTLKDKRWSGRIQEREKKYLTDLMNRL